MRVLAEAWLRDDVADSTRAASTKARYEYLVRGFIVPGVGELRIGEFTAGPADRFLRTVREKNGPATARTVRGCLTQMFGLAVRLGAVPTNPLREVSKIPSKKEPARALTREEAQRLMSKLRTDERAVGLDLVELVEFMLGTGARIGEVCALRPGFVDLDAGTVEIAATMTDAGGLEERTKTSTGHRVLAVPPHIVDMLRRRLDDPRVDTEVVVFPSPTGRLRDSSNTAAALRRAFDRAGFPWVRSHTLRKSVATWLDDAGLTGRQIADHLGHAQVSMTTDVYMGRRIATTAAA
ncbi:MAG: site-specific integrase [Mobilicoccus sp.]|nr:site-specific integrase [Mobilicoccus sp.]